MQILKFNLEIKQNQYISRYNNNRGSILLISFYVSIILLGLSIAFLGISTVEAMMAKRQKTTVSALHIAESGLQRAVYDLRQDCVANPNAADWSDGSINSMSIGPDTSNYYTITGYSGNSLNDGSYTVELKNITGKTDSVWVKSTGTIGSATQSVEAFVTMYIISPWHNALFGGDGSGGTLISGSFDALGSVHLLGASLSSSDYAFDLSTANLVGNNYSSLDAGLASKIPALPTITFESESIGTIESRLWVKKGLVGLTGSGTVGEAQATGNTHKETLDGVFVNDGYGGSKGASNVYSDNGTAQDYKLGNTISFPALSSHQAYLQANSLIIDDAGDLANFTNIIPTSSFSFADGNGSISFDGSGNMAVSGNVYIDGGNMALNQSGGDTTFTYTGSGTIYVSGNLQVNANLVTSGNNSFPTNVVGFMTPNTITFNSSGIDVMGLFYAEGSVSFAQDVNVVGSLVSHYFTVGASAPSIFQVPDTVNNLPTGLIGQTTSCYVDIVAWQR